MKIFTYGTLMKSHANHNKYLGSAEFIGNAILLDYALYNLGWYPGIKEYAGHKVKGEVYEIDTDTLRRLDIYEDEGDLYKRILVKVEFEDQALIEVETYIYSYTVSEEQLVDDDLLPWKGESIYER